MKVTPVTALRKFFGKKDGQTTTDFLQEMKALSANERIDLAKLVVKETGDELDLSQTIVKE